MKNRREGKDHPKQAGYQVQFSEDKLLNDDFPVSCPRCRNRLSDVARGACPKCGRIFRRKSLLIAQYGLDLVNPEFAPTPLDKYERAASKCSIYLLFPNALFLVVEMVFRPGVFREYQWVIALLVLLLFLTAGVSHYLKVRIDRANKAKQQRILKAIDAEPPKLGGRDGTQTDEQSLGGANLDGRPGGRGPPDVKHKLTSDEPEPTADPPKE